MPNRIIPTSIVVTRISLLLAAVTYTLLLAMVIYWHIDPSYFENWYIATPFYAGSANFTVHNSPVGQAMNLNDIGSPMIYWLFLRTSLFFLLVFFALKKVLTVLLSVKNRGAFQQESIRQFRHLAMIGMIYALIYAFNFGVVNGQALFHFKLPFEPLLFATACLVLAGIFKEGTRLNEDSNSII